MCAAQRNEAAPTVIARAAALLSAFGPGDDVLGVSELARRTGLAKSTVYRLTRELVRSGLLERSGTGLRLGLRLFELGQRVPRQRDLRSAALPFMEDLREATRQIVHLAVLDGTEMVYLEILRSPDAPAPPSRVGGRLPAHATGVGKAALAFSPPEVTDAVIAAGLRRLTRRTIVQPGLLRQELETIRQQGCAFDREESADGVVCAACPVFGPDGTVAGALSISGWSARMNLDRVAPAVRTAALALSRKLRESR
ncbi:IclR family transcriptional regulator [Thermomonospora curvata]|uniref:Transcriptional regulator, IclR family n=1 Tax=Thermomonospora curvata (strain ATCC 19995 / DSM 43183 / JCM 3096 / KCTC 9072 / NBRC 15933 / NCIMB 10081 / Henssen B9) TaxID=471852 RepID=D1A3K4_THECD|nr:IclR family transcriptional regulator [Thermomonospora curvata]ACY96129.1 transcriptional regulator, IclR family [Thermomonospora curvata DSM 43183]